MRTLSLFPPLLLNLALPLSSLMLSLFLSLSLPRLSIQPIRWPAAEVPPRQLRGGQEHTHTHTHTHTHSDKRPFRRRVIASMAMGKEGREQVSLWIKPRLLTSPWRWHCRSLRVCVFTDQGTECQNQSTYWEREEAKKERENERKKEELNKERWTKGKE